ncbi:NAD(P)H-dependent flavin oxidoreductase [Fictibacillus aquaticus]|uniref:Probable nitronate monooxygenase n=1 Tax=Fictibacillus aquaticus TaxID=2021314 RepID=A0A235F4H2_9BACL|nr:nitronate monooxygenase [Fictibacillus aquaticus]OYD56196.1 hypothetical protein CGZ90_18790 [Fictibacillus aquaticus]
MMKSRLTKIFGIDIPIIQAGMAGGPAGAALAAEVSAAGGLGTIGAGYMSPEEIIRQINSVKKQTDKPFAVNLFLPEAEAVFSEDKVYVMQNKLNDFREKLGLEKKKDFSRPSFSFVEQLEAALECGAKHFSFTFGCPPEFVMKKLKKHGATVTGTATSADEAVQLELAGVDVIAAQGSEAGGHRGTFSGDPLSQLTGTIALVPLIADSVSIPIAAAGGIMDGRGIAAAFSLGADGAMLGTAYLTSEESGASKIHKHTLLNSKVPTGLTKGFSGKYARGIQNYMMEELDELAEHLPYPIQHYVTSDIRKAAAEQGRSDMTSMWAGQAYSMSKECQAGALTKQLWKEAMDVVNSLKF